MFSYCVANGVLRKKNFRGMKRINDTIFHGNFVFVYQLSLPLIVNLHKTVKLHNCRMMIELKTL